MPDVFISYRHESADRSARVRRLAERFRDAGLNVHFDEFAEVGGGPGDGWFMWSTNTADQAESVLVIASDGWFERFRRFQDNQHAAAAAPEPEVGGGRGAAIEVKTIVNRLAKGFTQGDFLAVGYFNSGDLRNCPSVLMDRTFNLEADAEWDRVLNWLRRNKGGVSFQLAEPADRKLEAYATKNAGRPSEASQRIEWLANTRAQRFVGREDIRQQISDRLRANQNTSVLGPAGIGKTAVTAEALADVVGPYGEKLADSPWPDGVLHVDFYTSHADRDLVWASLANQAAGEQFMLNNPARARAVAACQGKRLLLVVEGGEEALGNDERPLLQELLSVLDHGNRWLVMTRNLDQTVAVDRVKIEHTLPPEQAAELFDIHTAGEVTGSARERVLKLLEGHPLAITWTAALLARGDEDPDRLADAWEAGGLGNLADPVRAEHTLEWLFDRSVSGLSDAERRVLAAAGLLARETFPLAAIEAGGGSYDDLKKLVQRSLLAYADRGAGLQPAGPPVAGYKPAPHYAFTHVLGYEFARDAEGSAADLRRVLAEWLHGELSGKLQSGVPLDLAPLQVLLAHAAALLRADHDRQLWLPLANFVLYAGSERLESLGRLDLVRTALESVSTWLGGVSFQLANGVNWERERSVAQCFLGILSQAEGNLDRANLHYRKYVDSAQRLADTDPGNAAWQRDLSVSLNNLGDLAVAEGKLPEAQRLFGQSRNIAQRLADSDPGNAAWQRDLSVSLNKLGNLAVAEGKLPEAQRLFGQSRDIFERLADTDPGNAAWQRDLSVSLEKLGNLAVAEGKLPEAQRLFGQDREIAQRLADSDPGNAAWQRDLAVSLHKLGTLHMKSREWADALPLLERTLTICEQLAHISPTNAVLQEDIVENRELVTQVRAELAKG